MLNGLKNVLYYIQGTGRKILLSYVPILVREHVVKQYTERRELAKLCLDNGSCLSCGCKTDELFLADKGCSLENYDEKTRMILVGRTTPCYGPMLSKKEYKQNKK